MDEVGVFITHLYTMHIQPLSLLLWNCVSCQVAKIEHYIQGCHSEVFRNSVKGCAVWKMQYLTVISVTNW